MSNESIEAVSEARERIHELVPALRANNFYWLADCFEKFVQGEAPTLDEAFGFVTFKKRGIKASKSSRKRDADIMLLKFSKQDPEVSWSDLSNQLGLTENQLRDAKQLVRVAKRWIDGDPLTAYELRWMPRVRHAFNEALLRFQRRAR